MSTGILHKKIIYVCPAKPVAYQVGSHFVYMGYKVHYLVDNLSHNSFDSKTNIFIGTPNEIENNSNQILDFTREVKNMANEKKIKIIESLWKIIYSNKEADIYETNLMRRLAGLLYIDSKTMGDIKDKIKNENS